jgi:hypothetical protein
MAREDGFLKDLFFAVGVATVALGTAYLVAKTVKKKLNIENESIFGEDCICVQNDEEDTTECEECDE